jgi:hypothetical protein
MRAGRGRLCGGKMVTVAETFGNFALIFTQSIQRHRCSSSVVFLIIRNSLR